MRDVAHRLEGRRELREARREQLPEGLLDGGVGVGELDLVGGQRGVAAGADEELSRGLRQGLEELRGQRRGGLAAAAASAGLCRRCLCRRLFKLARAEQHEALFGVSRVADHGMHPRKVERVAAQAEEHGGRGLGGHAEGRDGQGLVEEGAVEQGFVAGGGTGVGRVALRGRHRGLLAFRRRRHGRVADMTRSI